MAAGFTTPAPVAPVISGITRSVSRSLVDPAPGEDEAAVVERMLCGRVESAVVTRLRAGSSRLGLHGLLGRSCLGLGRAAGC